MILQMSTVSRQTSSRQSTGSRKKRSKDDSTKNQSKTVKLKTSLKTARIHSAVMNGKQTLLPCETMGLNLSKFDHNGREGRVSVYAEELYHMYNVFGHYKVIASFQPANSVQNQLFFGKTSHKREASGITSQSSRDRKTLSVNTVNKGTHVPAPTGGVIKKRRQSKPETFEELILKYKAQREKNHTGKQHAEVLEMLNSYKKCKEEWSRVEREFSSLEKVRRELARQETAGMDLRWRRQDESRKEDLQSSEFKLPVIKVSSVHDKKKRKVSKQDSKRLEIPKERVRSFEKWTTGVI